MPTPTKTRSACTLVVCLGVAALTLGLSLPMRAQEVPLKQQLRGRQRLLRKIYVNAPDHDVKGLAASIKADEFTVKHRVRAVRYLATVDSVAYPEAKEMLIDRLHNDRWEEVRFEAAKALRLMMGGNAEGLVRNQRLFRMWWRRWRRHTRRSYRTRVRGRYDFQSNPCDPMTLNALARTAYELDENEFCFEPSRRVREMAVQAIRASGVVCDVGPYVATSNPMRFSSKIDLGIGTEPTSLAAETKQDLQPPEQLVARSPKPPTANTASVLPSELDRDEAFNRVQQIAARMQEDIAALDEDIDWSLFEDAPANESQGTANAMLPDETLFDFENPAPVPKPLTTPAPCLNGYCPVGLWYEQELPALPEFSSVYEERVYQFSSAAAKQQFDNDPQQFAVAYGGFDPVAYASSQTLVDGEMLRTFNGHFYAFASQENWEEFISEPELYTLHPDDLLSDEEYREQAVEDFKAIESELTQMDNNGTGFEIEQGFGSEESNQPQLLEMDLDNIEPAFDIEEYEPAVQPETASTAPATNDETQAELSFGVLEFNEAEIAEYGDIQLLAPPPVANGQTDIDTFDEEPPLELIIEDEEAPFDEATDVLSEIEKILGVRRNPVPRNRTPQTNSSPTSRLTSKRRNNVATNAERWVAPWDDKTLITRVKAVAKSKVQQERAERLLPLTTPSPRRNQRTSTTWSSLITASNKTKSLTPKRRSATASLVTHSRGDMRVDSITSGSRSRRVPTRTIDVVDLAKKRRSLSTIRPRTTSHSADLVVPNRTSESIKRSSLVRPQTNQKRERSQRIIPRASQDNSLQMRSDPARVTTITRRR